LCSLNSILPTITRGVIAYMNCTDGSEEIILNFCKQHPGFIPAKYDYFDLYPNEDIGFKLSRYYNWTLALLPKNAWVIKIDADQIYNAEILLRIFLLPRYNGDLVILPKMQLHYDSNNLYFLKDYPFNFSRDHWLFYNRDGLVFHSVIGKFEAINIPYKHLLMAEISNYHFPAVKSRRTLRPDELVLFDDYVNQNFTGQVRTIRDSCNGNRRYSIQLLDKKMLSKEYIMHFVQQFDFS